MEGGTLRFIVLSLTKIGESSLVLHTLSEEYGRRGFLVSVSKGSPMALFLPLNILEAEVVENRKSDLWRLRRVSSLYPLDGIRSDVRKNAITLFMSEVLFRTIREGSSEQGLAQWCSRSLLMLDELDSDFSNFHLLWLLDLCSALGFRPCTEDLAPFLGDGLYPLARLLMTLPFAEALLVPMNGEQRNLLASALIDYLSFHTDSRIQVRSLKVLSELFR